MQLLCPYISHHTHQRASLPDTGPPASLKPGWREKGENFFLFMSLLEKEQTCCTSNVGLSLLTMFNI